MTAQNKRSATWKWVVTLLSVAALILCVVMALHSVKGTAMIGCAAGSSCDSVLSSKWSYLFGLIPVSGIAMGVYLAILLCLYFLKDRELAPIIWKLLLVFGGAIIGSAIWFFIIQKWILGSFCKYCMTAHSIGIIVSVILWVQALRNSLGKWNAAFMAAGLALAAGLAGVQLLTTPRIAYDVGRSDSTLPLISSDEAPVLGNPDATYKLDLMFDYQCSHCRKIHKAAKEIVAAHPDIAFILTPCPLSYACNPYVAVSGTDRFAGSCELARLALAIWQTKPDAFEAFDEWLFTADDPAKGWYPKTLDAATSKAREVLGGDSEYFEALRNAAISSLLAKSFELFGRTTQQGKSGIPRLVYKSEWVIPEVDDAEGLMGILTEVFGIPAN